MYIMLTGLCLALAGFALACCFTRDFVPCCVSMLIACVFAIIRDEYFAPIKEDSYIEQPYYSEIVEKDDYDYNEIIDKYGLEKGLEIIEILESDK